MVRGYIINISLPDFSLFHWSQTLFNFISTQFKISITEQGNVVGTKVHLGKTAELVNIRF